MSFGRIKERVALELGFEGHAISDGELLTQCNIAISIISARAPKLVVDKLSRTLSGETFEGAVITTVTGKYIQAKLPAKFFLIDSVWVGDEPAKATAFDQFEQITVSEPPQFAVADRVLRVNHTNPSDITLYCRSELPQYSAIESNLDPLEDYPPRFALLPAAYVLMQYPANPDVPREALRLQRNTAIWEAGLQDITQVYADRNTTRWRL